MIFGKFLQKENFMIIKKTKNETENLLKILNPFLQQNQRIRTQLYQNVNFNKHFNEEKPIKREISQKSKYNII